MPSPSTSLSPYRTTDARDIHATGDGTAASALAVEAEGGGETIKPAGNSTALAQVGTEDDRGTANWVSQPGLAPSVKHAMSVNSLVNEHLGVLGAKKSAEQLSIPESAVRSRR